MARGIYKQRVGRRRTLGRVPASLIREREQMQARLVPSTRQIFPGLRERLLASRPVVSAARSERPGRGGRRFSKPRVVPAVYGAPTFRNVIEDGVLK